MKIIRETDILKKTINALKEKKKTIGFAPTMGALHAGHVRLIRKANRENHRVISSIFVNPSQFNDPADLKKYPRTFEADRKLLEENACDILFFPSVEEIYPKETDSNFDLDLDGLDTTMEGAFRPGHFKGVAQVVKRLLDIVEPDILYMGQKDFQQFTIIQYMINQFDLPVKLAVCRTKREKDGLAMSSRNRRLNPSIRSRANILYKTLKAAKRKINTNSPTEIEVYAMNRLNIQDFNPEYFKIVEGHRLKEISDISKHKYVVACTAVWAGEVRLIDNMILKNA